MIAPIEFYSFFAILNRMDSLVLGIETSCDETSAAVLYNGALRSNVISSQLVHSQFGGVVPELASRAHQKLIVPVVNEALTNAGVAKEELSVIAAAVGPGLMGSLLVGVNFAKAFAYGLGIPFVAVNHMEAHIYSNFIDDPTPDFPFLNLTVSGGHTQLVLMKNDFQYDVVGETRDDAAGEAFDKVAKMLGLGYPGGPLIDRMAKTGNPKAFSFPCLNSNDDFDFSFSGVKTSVLYYLRDHNLRNTKIPNLLLADLCASFQSSVVDVLVKKTIRAAKKFGVTDVAVAGGVSANSGLRELMAKKTEESGLRLFIPKLEYCTDNGAMIAEVGYRKYSQKMFSSIQSTAIANLEL
ncbi:MAG: tRNA (adenosine(37)-N6)-threonylcarbamoyltransferase complex transferase subunit TsaD [Bacteroidota bacterium]|nr:tRNA (adenosine(37)-N6)-threonylcarbamoyltransferase complex transferase subunit TsaD [Bacteroidota bacterium]